MAGLDPAIHDHFVFHRGQREEEWITGSSPVMTTRVERKLPDESTKSPPAVAGGLGGSELVFVVRT